MERIQFCGFIGGTTWEIKLPWQVPTARLPMVNPAKLPMVNPPELRMADPPYLPMASPRYSPVADPPDLPMVTLPMAKSPSFTAGNPLARPWSPEQRSPRPGYPLTLLRGCCPLTIPDAVFFQAG